MKDRNKSIETALSITAGFLALYLWIGHPRLLYVAFGVAFIGLFWPRAANLLHRGWMLLAEGLGWFNSRVLLSVLFFVFLTPIAWFARALGRSSVELRRRKEGESYYVVRDHAYTREDLEQGW